MSPPATGWDLPPDSLDTSCVSDIVRLKYFINAVSTHAEKDSVSDAVTFCEYKDEIQKTLVRLGEINIKMPFVKWRNKKWVS